MLSNATVSVIHVTTTDDGLGNTTTETTEEVLEWALFAPRASEERADSRSPAVITSASVYGPFGIELDSDDLIVVSGHSPAANGEWVVEGMPGHWSLGDWRPGLEVAVKRTHQASTPEPPPTDDGLVLRTVTPGVEFTYDGDATFTHLEGAPDDIYGPDVAGESYPVLLDSVNQGTYEISGGSGSPGQLFEITANDQSAVPQTVAPLGSVVITAGQSTRTDSSIAIRIGIYADAGITIEHLGYGLLVSSLSADVTVTAL
jgi:hypothetical protein